VIAAQNEVVVSVIAKGNAMKVNAALSAVAAACCWALPAHAAIFTFTGNTTGGPTFTRPLEDLSGLSAVGVGVSYSTFNFTVSAAGDYSFLTTGEFDTFSILYSGSFSPASPLTNAIVANDDLIAPPFTTSGYVATLATGTNYVLVTTGFSDTDFGPYSVTIGGPGTVVGAVPEPAAYVLFGLGLGAILLRRRRAETLH
jgi:hypothetical protein